jgi:hypothetical protein
MIGNKLGNLLQSLFETVDVTFGLLVRVGLFLRFTRNADGKLVGVVGNDLPRCPVLYFNDEESEPFSEKDIIGFFS